MTPKQRDLLLYIQRYIDANQCAPSYEEMQAAQHLASKSGIHRLISALEAFGYLRKIPSRARSLELLKRINDPEAPLISDDGRAAFKELVKSVANSEPSFDHCIRARRLLERYP